MTRLSSAIDCLRGDIEAAKAEAGGAPGLQIVLPFDVAETLLFALDAMRDIPGLALKLPRPWIYGGVTAAEWCEAVDVISAVSGKSLLRAPSSAPAVGPGGPTTGFKPRGIA